MPGGIVLIVGTETAVVEADLTAGRLACPGCRCRLRPWGHVLLPDDSLDRRRDAIDVIGAALVAKAGGAGHRVIAAALDLPPTTVRGWLRRFGAMAERIRAHFTRWAHAFDPELETINPAGSAFADAVEAVGTATRAAVRRLGTRPPWSVASVLSGGALLANTSCPGQPPAERPGSGADRHRHLGGAMNDRQKEVALFRYSLIREAADSSLTKRERGYLVRELAGRDHAGPGGQRIRVARNTIDRWIRTYRSGGFEALAPAPRNSEPVTPAAVLALAEALKREVPRRTAAQVGQIIRTAEGWAPSERTLQRLFVRLGLNTRVDGAPPRAFGRFEADSPNDLWTGDALHGPAVSGRKTYPFAFIDDHSRALVGYRWGLSEDTVRLEAALRAGLGSRGVPRAIYVDNGSAFVSSQLLRACASLGIRLVHSRPGRPQGRGKIERFFETVRGQFLVEIEARGVGDLVELNRLFAAWVETVYHRRAHSETHQSPLERLGAAPVPALPSAEALHEAFLWSETRAVTKTATVSLHGNVFEVDAALVGCRVEVVFDPFDLESVEIRFQGRAMGTGVPVRISRHSHPKARPEAAPVVPTATGIDYLGLVARHHEEELAQAINYSQLAMPVAALPDETDDAGDVDAGTHDGGEEVAG